MYSHLLQKHKATKFPQLGQEGIECPAHTDRRSWKRTGDQSLLASVYKNSP